MEIRIKLLLLIFVFICGCSSMGEKEKLNQITKYYLNQFKDIDERNLTRKDIQDINYPLIDLSTNGVLKRALMLTISSRYGYTNYISGSGQAITMEGAAITKTNGFDNGLISLEINQSSPIVKLTNIDSWPSNNEKVYGFLTPSNTIRNIEFVCNIEIIKKEKIIILEYEYLLTKTKESCTGDQFNFENFYWVDNKGFVWQSKQWISPEGVFSELKILKPL